MKSLHSILLCLVLAGCAVTPPPAAEPISAPAPEILMPPMPNAGLMPHGEHSENSYRTAIVAPPPQKTVTVLWSFPTNHQSPDLIFKLWSTTNLARPLSTWAVKTNIPGTNRLVVLQATQQHEFFTLTASNYLGESGYATK